MTMNFSVRDAPPDDLMEMVERHLMQAAEALQRTIGKIEAGEFGEAGAAIHAGRTLQAVFQAIFDERTRVEKLRKHVTGTIGTSALDLHAARDEIGRRLACLRDAGAG